MKRKELFEFEDFSWFPNVIREGMTNLIKVFHKLMGTSEVISNLIIKVQEKHQFSQIVDLGSGAGGPMLNVIKAINEKNKAKPINLILTDYYPNSKAIEDIKKQNIPNVSYLETSLNAKDQEKAPKGLKTMIASFHHMNPSTAKAILQSAQATKQPILIYELAKNNIPFLVWLLFLPLSLLILIVMSLVMTFFVRPISFKQILFTYFIPIIPLVYAWDGQMSLMRTYTFEDIEGLLKGLESDDYSWEIKDAEKTDGKKVGYYVLGCPKE